jgi:hypothetical protein
MSTTQFGKFIKPEDREQLLEMFLQQRFEEFARSMAGYSTYSLAAATGNVTLPVDNARSRVVVLTGAPSGAVTLKIDDSLGANADLLIINSCTGSNSTVTVKSAGANSANSGGIVVAKGVSQAVRQDGDSVYAVGAAVKPDGSAPCARVFNSTDLAIPNTTHTILAFDSERYDTDTIHSTSSNTSRLTCVTPGVYAISAHVSFAPSAAGTLRAVHIRLNGATFIAVNYDPPVGGGFSTNVSVSTQYRLAAGDYVEVDVYQDSGGSLNVQAAGNYSPEFGLVKVSG